MKSPRTASNPPDGQAHLVDNLEEALDAASSERLARRDVPRDLLVPATPVGLLRMSLEEYGMLVLLWLALSVVPAWLYPVIIVFIAGRFHALGVILHDAAHMPMRGKSLSIRLVEILCGYPMASTLNAMRYHHLRHHRDSGMETDPYFKTGRQTPMWWTLNVARGVLVLPFWTIRALVGAVATFVPSLRTPYARIFLQDRSRQDLRDSREVLDCARAEFGQLLFQVAVVGALVRWPGALVIGYLVPITITLVIAAYRLLMEHEYERTADRRMETIITTTRDNHFGVVGAIVLAPRNIGYHIVHHLHPQVGLAALPQLRDWYARQHPAIYPPPRH